MPVVSTPPILGSFSESRATSTVVPLSQGQKVTSDTPIGTDMSAYFPFFATDMPGSSSSTLPDSEPSTDSSTGDPLSNDLVPTLGTHPMLKRAKSGIFKPKDWEPS